MNPAMSPFTKRAMLNGLFRAVTYQAPEKVYVALMTSGGEVQGNGYERQEVRFGEPRGDAVQNADDVIFPVAEPEGWGEVVRFRICDAPEGGNELTRGDLERPVGVEWGDQFVFRAGRLSVGFAE